MNHDYLIIGAGIIGLSMAREIRRNEPDATILVIDKEDDVARHASGRNSGILHAGFYYSADSFKAKFTVAGNIAMKEYCRQKNLPINACGKLVVAQNDHELEQLQELYRRGMTNGSNVRLVSADEAKEFDPQVRTYKQALYSPDTASIDPEQVCQSLKQDLLAQGIQFQFHARYLAHQGNTVKTSQGDFSATKIFNCAGLYADRIAQDFGFGHQYTMIPFKGLYLKYTKNKTDIAINIYPVPNLQNPFLGVHYTKTVDGSIKIGPTAIPAFWRENYKGLQNFKPAESISILFHEALLFLTNSFHFRDLAFEEIRKYRKAYFIGLAQAMVNHIDPCGFTEYTRPGIRAQLLDKKTLSLVQDFVIKGDRYSTHILNAVSPAYTCAFPFAAFVYRQHL
ncbi:MAG TPA: L-2-hydroxyglutarate oxidase [Candidatus Bathyarchaeia archaeon]|nr:L-2-hydroxyglutarate oxidase [Candidatus Bathyarchaeia archaeon]